MYKEKIIKCPLYGNRVCFVATDENEKFNNKHPEVAGLDETVFAHTIRAGIKIPNEEDMAKCVFIILNPKYKFGDYKFTHGTITHERFHATSILLDFAGIKPDYDNDEAGAYLIEYLVDEVTEFLKPYWDGK